MPLEALPGTRRLEPCELVVAPHFAHGRLIIKDGFVYLVLLGGYDIKGANAVVERGLERLPRISQLPRRGVACIEHDAGGRRVGLSHSMRAWFEDGRLPDLALAARRELSIYDYFVSVRVRGQDGPADWWVVVIEPLVDLKRPGLLQLTRAERAVAISLVTGATLGEIARDRGRSLETVRALRRRLYARLAVRTRAGLIEAASGVEIYT